MNDWMAQMQRNSVAYQQQQQMAMASAMAAGIHPSMWTAQYNMLLSGQNPAVMGILRPSSQSAETQSTAETKEKIKGGGPDAARMKVSDSCNSYQGRDSPVDAAGLYRPVAGYPSRNKFERERESVREKWRVFVMTEREKGLYKREIYFV